MNRIITFLLGIGAMVFFFMGTRFPLAEVPLLGELNFHEATWGGKIRLGVILALLFLSMLGFAVRRFEKVPLILASCAIGFVGNVLLSAFLWREENTENLAQLGSEAIANGVVWQAGAAHFALGAVLCVAYCIALIARRTETK